MLESKQRQIADAEKLPIPTVQAIIDGKLTGALSGNRCRSRGRGRPARLRSAPGTVSYTS
jgi:hypothetical protein